MLQLREFFNSKVMNISITMENINQYYMHVHNHKMNAIVKHCKHPKVISLKILNCKIFFFFGWEDNDKN